MPVDYKKYPKNWKEIRKRILNRASHHYLTGNHCELCYAKDKDRHWLTGSKVVLTIHHINFNINDNRDYNLVALCQRCHNKLDMPYRIDNRLKIKSKRNNEKPNS